MLKDRVDTFEETFIYLSVQTTIHLFTLTIIRWSIFLKSFRKNGRLQSIIGLPNLFLSLFFLSPQIIIKGTFSFRVPVKDFPYCKSTNPPFHTHYYHLTPIFIFLPRRLQKRRLPPFYSWWG